MSAGEPSPELSPEACHAPLVVRAPRILAFDREAYFPEWQSAVRRSFKQLLGGMPARVPLNARILAERKTELAREIELIFTSELHADIPATLLIPSSSSPPFPAMICMQGHGGTRSISIGRPANVIEQLSIANGYDFAVQAVREGYAALAFDMRAFGARADQRPGTKGGCHHAAMTALLLGRTLIGERVLDISRAIDLLETFPEIDKTRIGCMGHSGGGLAAYYAAAFDPRIAAVLCSGCLCTYRDSIAAIDHCADNYLPGILHYFDMPDIAGLIVPRPLAIIAGESDAIFPAAGVKECAEQIRDVYAAQGVERRMSLMMMPGEHAFFPRASWEALKEIWKQKT